MDLSTLRRSPDVEAANLHAVDATDRAILAEAAEEAASCGPGELVVVGDRYGALTLGAADRFDLRGIRVHTDRLTGELALARNARAAGLENCWRPMGLEEDLFAGARLVLVQLPASLPAWEEVVDLAARACPPGAVVVAGGRVKHMTPAQTDVLRAGFTDVRVGLARWKSRLLRAAGPIRPAGPRPFPRRRFHPEFDLWVVAHGAAFSGTRIDPGTRALLRLVPRIVADLPEPDGERAAVDLGCGTGVLAAAAARAAPGLRVVATDTSAAAVASAAATARANGVERQVAAWREDAAARLPAGCAQVVMCNPPFHIGTTAHAGAAHRLLEAGVRLLAPGGAMWTVYNTSLDHARYLRRLAPTRVEAREGGYTITVTTAPA